MVERRQELLRLEGMGITRPDITKQLSEKYQVSARAIHYDYEHRPSWQPVLVEFADSEKVLMKIINRYEQIYGKAAYGYLTSEHEQSKVGYLRVMLEATAKVGEAVVLPGIMRDIEQLKEQVGAKKW